MRRGRSVGCRSSLQRFNEQLTPLFSLLQQLDGVQLAAHLLEPSLALEKEIELNEKRLLGKAEAAAAADARAAKTGVSNLPMYVRTYVPALYVL